MRNNIGANWAFGIRGAIENIARNAFPSEVRLWPTLQNFDFECYSIGERHLAIIIKDKLTGIPTGSDPKPFMHHDHPTLPPTKENIEKWQSYLFSKLELRHEDAALIIPLHDSGKSSALEDYNLFDQNEVELWDYQLRLTVARQRTTIQTASKTPPQAPTHITYNVSGTNARVNIQSSDSSVNIVNEEMPQVFGELLNALKTTSESAAEIDSLKKAVVEMQNSYGTQNFLEKYKTFMSILSDHIQVLGPIVAPYLPALAGL
jgi:hypothetical protein